MTVTDNVKKLLIIIALLAFQTAEAQLEIEIISGNASALPIAIVPFQWQDAGPPPSDGVEKIVFTGSMTTAAGSYTPTVGRLLIDGTADTTFDSTTSVYNPAVQGV